MRNSHIHPLCLAPFNFFNGIWMKIILNKWNNIGMGVTYLKLAPLPSLATCIQWGKIYEGN